MGDNTNASITYSAYSAFNGISNARIAFFDIGYSDGSLSIPADLGANVFYPLYAQGARIISNSWGSMTNSYTSDARSVDRFMAKYPDALVVFSAGNSGANGAYSVTAPSTNKNGLAVGATLSSDDSFVALYGSSKSIDDSSMASFSSVGPTSDNRMKPDISAPGFWIVSAAGRSSSSDGDGDGDGDGCHSALKVLRGTSMATPVVSASAVKVQRMYLDGAVGGVPFTPSGALIKATLIQSAQQLYTVVDDSFETTDLSGAWPDTVQGYGAMQLERVMNDASLFAVGAAWDTGDSLFQCISYDGDEVSFSFTAKTTSAIRATLAYTDTVTSSSSSSSVLVNVLSLKLTNEGTGTVYKPAGSDSGIDLANVQTISVDSPVVNSVYTYTVTGNYIAAVQPFALVVQGFGNTTSISSHTASTVLHDLMGEASRRMRQFAALDASDKGMLMSAVIVVVMLTCLFLSAIKALIKACIGGWYGGRTVFRREVELHCPRWPWVEDPAHRRRRHGPVPSNERVWVSPQYPQVFSETFVPVELSDTTPPPSYNPSAPPAYKRGGAVDLEYGQEAHSPMHPQEPMTPPAPLVQAYVIHRSAPAAPYAHSQTLEHAIEHTSSPLHNDSPGERS
jgi:hypothetical protein